MALAAALSDGLAHVGRWRLTSAAILLVSAGLATFLGMLAALSGPFSMIVGLVVVLSLLVLIKPNAGIAMMTVLLPLSSLLVVPRQLLGITGLSPSNLLLAATLGAVVLHWLWARFAGREGRLPPLPKQLVWLYVVPVVAAGLHGATQVALIPDYYQTIQVVSFDTASGYLRDVVVRPMFLIVFALLIAMVFRDAKDPRWILPWVALCGLLLAGLVYYVVILFGGDLTFLSSAGARSFLSGLGMHANELSLLLNSVLAFALFGSRGCSGALRMAHMAVALVLAVAVVLTFSRGGFVGLLVLYVMFMVYSGNVRQLLLSVCLGLVIALFLPTAVIERATLGWASGDREAISAGRLDSIWAPLLPAVLDNLWFGGGLSSVLWSAPARTGQIFVAHAHNAYLQLLLDFGVVGSVLVMSFYWWAMRTVRQASRTATSEYWKHFFVGAAAAIVLLFAQGLSDDRFTPSATQVFMWFGIGAAIGYLRRSRNPLADASATDQSATPPPGQRPRARPFGTGRSLRPDAGSP